MQYKTAVNLSLTGKMHKPGSVVSQEALISAGCTFEQISNMQKKGQIVALAAQVHPDEIRRSNGISRASEAQMQSPSSFDAPRSLGGPETIISLTEDLKPSKAKTDGFLPADLKSTDLDALVVSALERVPDEAVAEMSEYFASEGRNAVVMFLCFDDDERSLMVRAVLEETMEREAEILADKVKKNTKPPSQQNMLGDAGYNNTQRL